MTAHPEGHLQEVVARLLDAAGFLWMHPANERKCAPIQGAILKRSGVKSGVPDVLIFDRTNPADPVSWYSGLAIELKAAGGRVGPAQRAWMDALTERGWICAVCRSVDEVVELVKQHYPGRVR